MSTHRIWMGPVPPNGPDDSYLEAGWYGRTDATINQPIYWRVQRMADALVYTRQNAIRLILDMRDLGYPCHAVPPIEVTL